MLLPLLLLDDDDDDDDPRVREYERLKSVLRMKRGKEKENDYT